MKRQDWIWLIGGVLAAGGLGVLVYFLNRPTKLVPKTTGSTGTSTGGGASTPAGLCALSTSFPLKVGSKGGQVCKLQEWLNKNVLLSIELLDIDGDFGPLTLAAVNKIPAKFPNWSGTYVAGQVQKDFYDTLIGGGLGLTL
jgi:peptidoglycan hydrolase-like protein with peptidoglycan-binding domain